MKLIKKNVRLFNNFDEYSDYYDEHEHFGYVVDIVENDDAAYPNTVADAEFECKNWKTAVKRLAAATGWDWILGELEADTHSEDLLSECDSVSITVIDDEHIYIAARQYK